MEEKQRSSELAIVSKEELSLVNENSLNEMQLQHILKRTPPRYVKERPGKGGQKFRYVTGGYMKKCLNLMFGWDWDFEIVEEKIYGKQVVVRGKLTCRTNGRAIIKTQYGGKDIVYFKDKPDQPVDLANDFKAAATDCLKKCAAEIGIAADIYSADEFREIRISEAVSSERKMDEIINDENSSE